MKTHLHRTTLPHNSPYIPTIIRRAQFHDLFTVIASTAKDTTLTLYDPGSVPRSPTVWGRLDVGVGNVTYGYMAVDDGPNVA